MPTKSKENTVHFKRGDILFHEGAKGDHFFVIIDGKVEVTKKGKNREQIPLAVLGAGQCVGEFSVLDGRPRSATVTALSDVSAVKIGALAVEKQIKAMPSWFVTITRNLISRIREIDNILKRNNIVDAQLVEMIRAIEYNADKTAVPFAQPGEEKLDSEMAKEEFEDL